MKPDTPRKLAWMQRITAAAIIAFWALFLADHGSLPAGVVDFEWCFVLPDLLWISALLLAASQWLLKGHPRWITATAAAGGALVFLGLLDFMFNLRHGQYTASATRGLLNGAINAYCVLFGLWGLAVASSAAAEKWPAA
jgi:hypothetical protein